MVFGKRYYITDFYNPKRFQILLESNLSRKGPEIDDALIEQVIAAYLDCTENFKNNDVKYASIINEFDKLFENLEYSDHRIFCDTKNEYDQNSAPIDALKAFMELVKIKKRLD